jgi:hypothetical protein
MCIGAADSGFAEGPHVEADAALYKQCVPERDSNFSEQLNAVILKVRLSVAFQQALLSESENVFYASADQVRSARRSFGDIPLIVLTRSTWSRRPDWSESMLASRIALWTELHSELAALSTRGENRIVAGAGHYIQLDQPHAVVDAIGEVLDAAQHRPHAGAERIGPRSCFGHSGS